MATTILAPTDPTDPTADAEELLRDGALEVNAACEFAGGISRAQLYREMQAGAIPYVLRGRRRMIPRRALTVWLARGLRGGNPDRPAA